MRVEDAAIGQLRTLRECADLTRTSLPYWRRLVAEGKIPAVRLGRLVRVDERTLQAWLRRAAVGK
jgi:excisionase family DNA binding protein